MQKLGLLTLTLQNAGSFPPNSVEAHIFIRA